MSDRCVRGRRRVCRRVQLPLLELPCHDGLSILVLGEIERDKIRLIAPADAVLTVGDADSGQAFACATCVSLLYWSVRDGAHVRGPYGTLADEPALKPTAHIFVGSKASWHEILDDLPRHHAYP